MDGITFKLEGYSVELLGSTGHEEAFSYDEMDMSRVEMCGQEESASMGQAEESESRDENESYAESTPEMVDLGSGSEDELTLAPPRIDSSEGASFDSGYPADAADVQHDHIFAKTSKPSRSNPTKSEAVQPQLIRPKPPSLSSPAPFPQYVFYSTPDSQVFQLATLEIPATPGPAPLTSTAVPEPEQEVITGIPNEPENDMNPNLNSSLGSSFGSSLKKQSRRPGAKSELMNSSLLNIDVPGGMSMKLQRYIYTEALCRICLLAKSKMTPIFEDVNISEDGTIANSRGPNSCKKFNLIPALKQMMDIEVSFGDGLPDQICFECMDNLMSFSEFRQRISYGQGKLSEVLDQVKNTSSPTVIPPLGVPDMPVPNFYRHVDLINNVRVMLRTTKYSHNVLRYLPDRILEKIFNVISVTVGFKSGKLKSLETYAVDPPYVKGWFCAVCRETIHGTTTEFIQHFRDEHGVAETELLFPCDLCDDHFALLDRTGLSENYAAHWIQHFFFYECDLCRKRMPSAKGVWVHKRSSHGSTVSSKSYNCPTCTKSFIKKSHLVAHAKIHLKPEARKRYMSWCTICGKGLNSSLSTHMNVVHKNSEVGREPRWKCEVCSKEFTEKKNLISHRKSVHVNIDCICELCGETFPSYSAKSLHALKHTGAQSYPCDQCDKKFLTAALLKNHQGAQHGPNLGFTCDVCSKSFKRKMYLSEHLKVHAEPQHICPYPSCGKAIRLKSNWYKHLKVHERRGDKKPQRGPEEEQEMAAFEITLNLEPE